MRLDSEKGSVAVDLDTVDPRVSLDSEQEDAGLDLD